MRKTVWILAGLMIAALVAMASTAPADGTSRDKGTESITATGTTSAQNSQYLNGINVGDPSAIGAAGYYYDFDAFDDIQVSTGAHDITVPTGGVFLNMVQYYKGLAILHDGTPLLSRLLSA